MDENLAPARYERGARSENQWAEPLNAHEASAPGGSKHGKSAHASMPIIYGRNTSGMVTEPSWRHQSWLRPLVSSEVLGKP